jgi:hypothetical protein
MEYEQQLCQEGIVPMTINKQPLYQIDKQVFLAMTDFFLRVDFTGLLCQFGTCVIHTMGNSVS